MSSFKLHNTHKMLLCIIFMQTVKVLTWWQWWWEATKLDQLFEREGGVNQVFKKNYVSAYTVKTLYYPTDAQIYNS